MTKQYAGIYTGGAESYANLFERYVRAADGKQVVGRALAKLLAGIPNAQVLDMGAGRGEITEIMASRAQRVDAVEPNEHLIIELKKIVDRKPNIHAISGSLEEFSTNRRYDLIVLSYVLESIRSDEAMRHMRRLFELLRPGGRVVGVTFLDGCDWDAYSAAVERLVHYGRAGGTGRVFDRLRDAGINARLIETLNTHIAAATPEELYQALGFFYKRQLSRYIERYGTLSSELMRYANVSKSRAFIEVKEVIYEILPMVS